MAIKNEEEINRGRWVAITFTLLTDLSAVMVGLMGRYFFEVPSNDMAAVLGNGGQNVLSMLVSEVMPPVIVGVYVAVVLAAIMPTVDSLIALGISMGVACFLRSGPYSGL